MLMRQWLVRHQMILAAFVVEALKDALARIDDDYDNCKTVLRADLRRAYVKEGAGVRDVPAPAAPSP